MRDNNNEFDAELAETTRSEFNSRAIKPSRRNSKWNFHGTKKRPKAVNGMHNRRNKRSY